MATSPPTPAKPAYESSVRFARHNFDNLQGLIRFADTKAGSILVVLIFLFGTAVTTVRETISFTRTHQIALLTMLPVWSSWALFALVGLAVMILVGRVVLPKAARHYRKPDKSSDLMYWKHILLHDSNVSYCAALECLDERLELRNLADQTYELAHIVDAKMQLLDVAQRVTFILALAWLSGLLLSISVLATGG